MSTYLDSSEELFHFKGFAHSLIFSLLFSCLSNTNFFHYDKLMADNIYKMAVIVQ